MVGVIGAVLHESLEVVERWHPEKTKAYFNKALEIHKMLRVQL